MDDGLTDGIIELDSNRGATLGFTSDRFGSGSYLWKTGPWIVVSFIESLSKGNFRDLVNAIRSAGLGVKIPTPLFAMQRIVQKCGYRHTVEYDQELGPVDVWVLDAEDVDTHAEKS